MEGRANFGMYVCMYVGSKRYICTIVKVRTTTLKSESERTLQKKEWLETLPSALDDALFFLFET